MARLLPIDGDAPRCCARRNRRAAPALLTMLVLAVTQGPDARAQSADVEPPAKPSAALLGNIDFAVDGDGVHVSGVRLGGAHPCGAFLDELGYADAATGATRVSRPVDATSLASALLRTPAARGLRARAGFVQVAGRTRVVGDAAWHAPALAGTSLTVLAARDLVGTADALARGVGYEFVGGSAERALLEGVSAQGLAGYQSFTDGNERVHVRARLTWQVAPRQGLDVQVRWRQFESRDNVPEPGYFNPERYSQWQGMLDVHRKVGAWTLAGSIGAGYETVDGAEARPVRAGEVRAEGALVDKLHVTVHARYNGSADDSDATDYSYRQAGVTLSYPF